MADAVSLLDRVEVIARSVAGGRIGRARPWGGADVVIAVAPPTPSSGPSFYPDPLYVVTPHARELSWLFQTLGREFSDTLDHLSKLKFYGRLAEASNRYLEGTAPDAQTAAGLLVTALEEARVLAVEFQPAVRVQPDAVPGTSPLTDSNES